MLKGIKFKAYPTRKQKEILSLKLEFVKSPIENMDLLAIYRPARAFTLAERAKKPKTQVNIALKPKA